MHGYYTTAFHLFTSSNYGSVVMPPTCIRGKRFAVVLSLDWKMMGQCLHKNHNLLYYPLPTHHRNHSHEFITEHLQLMHMLHKEHSYVTNHVTPLFYGLHNTLSEAKRLVSNQLTAPSCKTANFQQHEKCL